MKKLILLLTFVVTIASCKSPCEISERKIQKIEARCPESLLDTVVVRDTIVIPQKVVSDTSFVTELYDTITFTKNDVRVKIRRINDTIVVDSIICLTDTVFFEKEIIVEKMVLQEKEPFFKRFQIWIVILFGLVGAFLMLKLTKWFFE